MPMTSFKLLIALAFLPSSSWGLDGDASSLRGASDTKLVQQVIVIDAGSSGTRIHIFNFLPGAAGEPVPRIDLSVVKTQKKKLRPGLSSFAESGDLDGAERNIEELMEFAGQFVPAAQRPQTPVLLKATAGLRLVKPAEKGVAMLKRVRDTLLQSGYFFKAEWADIIIGKEEAGLAWVAANYLQGNFKAGADADATLTLGVIEMGGGSTQVVFEVPSSDASRLAEIDHFTFSTLTGHSHHLYAHGYPGFGMDYIQARHSTSMPAAEAEDPCYPVGYFRQKVDASELIQGTGNADKCQDAIKSRLLSTSKLAPGQYSAEMPLRGEFVAIANFYWVRYVAEKNGLKISWDANQAAMKESAKLSCERILKPTAEEEAAMKAGTADPFKEKGCFGFSYQVAFLEALQAFTLPDVKVQDIDWRTITGGGIDWALGAALMHYESGFGKAPSETADSPLTQIVLFVLFVVAILGAAWFFLASRSQPVGKATFSAQAIELTSQKLMPSDH